jgi:hypothetical protein
MKEIILAMISGGVFVFLQFLISRYDSKHSELNDIREDIKGIRDYTEQNKKSIEDLRSILISIETDNKKQSELINLQAQEIIGLGHDKLVYLTNQIAQRGCITLKEIANLEALYQPYHAMGANGDGKAGYEHCMKLDVVSEERARELDREIKRHAYGIDKAEK